MSKKVNIALFGFGRIGRNLFRLGYDNPNYNFVAVSDFGSAEALHYLLVRDSIHGAMKEEVTLDGNHFIVRDQKTRVISGGEPGTIPWDAYDVDVVIDATGRFLNRDELSAHLDSGAKRVFISRNAKDTIDRYVIPGINESSIKFSDQIISTTSSTTQVLALMVKMLDESFGLNRAMMTTVHAYTADQSLADAAGVDLRRSRSAVENIIPNTTLAPSIVENLMPQFSGKLDGISALYTTEGKEPKLYTRGNGSVGQDVSHLIPFLRFPKRENLVIRGEIIITKTKFSEKSSIFDTFRGPFSSLIVKR